MVLTEPEPAEVIALTPDGPPQTLRWRGVDHTVLASQGPERIGGEWWRGRHPSPVWATRDYFRVQDERGRWLWLYRVLETGRWFVHGQWA